MHAREHTFPISTFLLFAICTNLQIVQHITTLFELDRYFLYFFLQFPTSVIAATTTTTTTAMPTLPLPPSSCYLFKSFVLFFVFTVYTVDAVLYFIRNIHVCVLKTGGVRSTKWKRFHGLRRKENNHNI